MSTFNAITFYGYLIKIPSDVNTCDYIHDLYILNSILQSNFEICGIISTISHDVDYSDYENVNFILGFRPSNDVYLVQSNGLTLEDYIRNDPILDGIEFSSTPAFYAGIEWVMPEVFVSESESESESDPSDSDSDPSDSDSDSDSDSNSDVDSNSDDEITTCDNMNTK